MYIAEVVYRIVTVVVQVFMLSASFYGFHAIYYAYFKTKDERQQYIVLRSTANAFAILLVYFVLDTIVQFSHGMGAVVLARVWAALHFGIEYMPAAAMTTVLGLCLFIHKRRAGGG